MCPQGFVRIIALKNCLLCLDHLRSTRQRRMAEPPQTQACTFYILTQPYPPPTLCLCSELEWLVFHFGLPGALLHSLAWPVYHYWSLSLTWTNRGLFSKVVSQVAVTDMSGTTGLRAWLEHTVPHEKNLPGYKPDSIIHGTQAFW